MYNLEFKLFDHLDPVKKISEPFAVIRAFPEEDPRKDSLLEDVVYRYKTYQINQRFHINLLDYLKLPVPLARSLDDIAERIVRPIEDTEIERKNRALNKSMGDFTEK